MSRFEVDVVLLDQLARTLTEIGALLASAGVTPDDGEALGDERAAAALRRFTRRWRNGVHQLGETSDTAGRLVAQAAQLYRDVDGKLSRAMSGVP
jgi:hypothetical protein